ncbi:hypothetical protein C8J56DRAFT_1079729 [Mycena floridula]|nr:hypothetical protein C8J56DRAFT_1079729 [Mycena floridula]
MCPPEAAYHPNLLVHMDLGGFRHDPRLNSRLENLLDGTPTFLVNASGSGKTRLLYEGLCQNWGFYLTAVRDSSKLVSYDLKTFWIALSSRPTFFDSIPFQPLVNNNRRIARIAYRRFSELLLARLLIFRVFVQEARRYCETLCEEHKRRWLLVQLMPPYIHIFSSLTRILQEADEAWVFKTIGEIFLELSSLTAANASGKFIITLDETQSPAQLRGVEGFRDEVGPYPVLKELVHVWRDQTRDLPVTMIVAGEEIPKEYFLGRADAANWADFRRSSDTGAFDSEALRKQYLLRYLPPRFVDTAAGKEIVERMWRWCSSRHRCTTPVIGSLFDVGLMSPSQLLNNCIWQLTKYHPSDSILAGSQLWDDDWSTSPMQFDMLPTNLFPNQDCRDFETAFENLANPVSGAGKFTMLRVVVSFPTSPPLVESLRPCTTASPFAALINGPFEQVTTAFSGPDIVASATLTRKRHLEEPEPVVAPTPRSRRRLR